MITPKTKASRGPTYEHGNSGARCSNVRRQRRRFWHDVYSVSPGYVSLENAKSVRSLVTIQVDQGTNFDIEVEGAAESGGPWHPIVNLTQAGAIDLSDGSAHGLLR